MLIDPWKLQSTANIVLSRNKLAFEMWLLFWLMNHKCGLGTSILPRHAGTILTVPLNRCTWIVIIGLDQMVPGSKILPGHHGSFAENVLDRRPRDFSEGQQDLASSAKTLT